MHGFLPLPDGDLEIRQTLATNLLDPEYYPTHTYGEFDGREIMKSFPKFRLPGLIIHKRFVINENIVQKMVPGNLCIECKFLVKGGKEDLRYTKALFRAKDVATYVQKTKSNLIVSLLHRT